MKPRLLDLFCGAGGAAMGYYRAGFEVVGVDIKPQPHYPFEFHQGDALEYCSEHGREFDVIHASPPCQHYSRATAWRGNRDNHPDLIGVTLSLLKEIDKLWIIENVPDAPIEPHFLLCGSMFGLNIRRHRYFMTSYNAFTLLPPCNHVNLMSFEHKFERAYGDAMGCDWMNRDEHRQAIPPAYTEFIGKQLMRVLA